MGFLLLVAIFYQLAIQKRKVTIGRQFQGDTIRFDGQVFDQCEFTDCVFRWDGGPFSVVNCRFSGINRIETRSKQVVDAIDFLKALGFLTPDFAKDWKHLPPEYFMGP